MCVMSIMCVSTRARVNKVMSNNCVCSSVNVLQGTVSMCTLRDCVDRAPVCDPECVLCVQCV